MKNRCIQWFVTLCKWLNIPNRKGKDPSSFLIVSTTGVGDTLWATPAIRAIKERFPTAHVAVLTSRIGEEILKYHPLIDALFIFKPSFVLFWRLKKKKFGTIFLFHASQRSVFPFAFFLGPEKLIGTRGINKGLDFLFTQLLDNSSFHEIERRLQIVETVGAKRSTTALEFFFSKTDEQIAETFLKNEDTIVIGIHPGAQKPFKQWHREGFIRVGQRLKELVNCSIFVTGSEEERSLVEHIASKIPGATATFLPLRPLAALIKKMRLFIVNDTGPMHIAYSVATPTVALFCPTDPTLCGPYQYKQAIVIEKPLTCAPCIKKRCKEPFCLLQISIEEVINACQKLL